MKTTNLLFFLVLIFLGCQMETKKVKYNNITEFSNNKTIVEKIPKADKDSSEVKLITNNRMFDYLKTNYQNVYEYRSRTVRQLVGLTYTSKDSVDYFLSIETLPCDVEYKGKAYNQNYGMDPEIDEDEEGNSFPVIEYIHDNKTQAIYLKVALDSSKLKISYVNKEDIRTDCLPNSQYIMRKVN